MREASTKQARANYYSRCNCYDVCLTGRLPCRTREVLVRALPGGPIQRKRAPADAVRIVRQAEARTPHVREIDEQFDHSSARAKTGPDDPVPDLAPRS